MKISGAALQEKEDYFPNALRLQIRIDKIYKNRSQDFEDAEMWFTVAKFGANEPALFP